MNDTNIEPQEALSPGTAGFAGDVSRRQFTFVGIPVVEGHHAELATIKNNNTGEKTLRMRLQRCESLVTATGAISSTLKAGFTSNGLGAHKRLTLNPIEGGVADVSIHSEFHKVVPLDSKVSHNVPSFSNLDKPPIRLSLRKGPSKDLGQVFMNKLKEHPAEPDQEFKLNLMTRTAAKPKTDQRSKLLWVNANAIITRLVAKRSTFEKLIPHSGDLEYPELSKLRTMESSQSKFYSIAASPSRSIRTDISATKDKRKKGLCFLGADKLRAFKSYTGKNTIEIKRRPMDVGSLQSTKPLCAPKKRDRRGPQSKNSSYMCVF